MVALLELTESPLVGPLGLLALMLASLWLYRRFFSAWCVTLLRDRPELWCLLLSSGISYGAIVCGMTVMASRPLEAFTPDVGSFLITLAQRLIDMALPALLVCSATLLPSSWFGFVAGDLLRGRRRRQTQHSSSPPMTYAATWFVASYAVLVTSMWFAIPLSKDPLAAVAYITGPYVVMALAGLFAAVGCCIGLVVRARQTRQRQHLVVALVASVLCLLMITGIAMHARGLSLEVTLNKVAVPHQ